MSQSEETETFTRVGRDKMVYQYTKENAQVFVSWFKTTTWFRTQEELGARKKTIKWGAKRRAAGWEHFIEGAQRMSGDPKIICTRCDQVLTHPTINGTTGMTEHPVSNGCQQVSKQRGLQQLTIREGFVEQRRRVREEQLTAGPFELIPENFDKQLMRTVIACHWPITVVDSLEFARLLRCSNSPPTIMSSSTLTRKILDHRATVENEIVQRLPPAPAKIAIVLDCWSAPRREGFIAIKAYWITEDWDMAEAMIGFEGVGGNHTGASLGEVTFRRLQKFGLERRVAAITSDNASNNKTLKESVEKAIQWLNQRLSLKSIALIPCLAHVIQLAVNHLLVDIKIAAKNNEIKKNWEQEEEERVLAAVKGTPYNGQSYDLPYTVAKSRAIALFINHSEKRWEIFRQIQKDVAAEEGSSKFFVLRCFQDVKTRWDSTNRMLMRLKKLQKSVNRFTQVHCPYLALNDQEWQQIDYLITILRPFAVFTQLIGTTRDPTIHQVYEVYNILLNHLERCKAKLQRKRVSWKRQVLKGLESAEAKLKLYYSKTEFSEAGKLYGVAILLNPVAKETTWQSAHWVKDRSYQTEYWVYLEELYKDEYMERTPNIRRMVLPKNLQKKKVATLDDVMGRLVGERDENQQTDLTDGELELDDYRQFDVPQESPQPLHNWRLIEKRFPRIAMMARDILAIQAAGVGIEREFSIAGAFNLDRRTYSAALLSALMVCNHAQNEENRIMRRQYYLECRVEMIELEDLEAELAEDENMVDMVVKNMATVDISEDEEEDNDEDDIDLDDEIDIITPQSSRFLSQDSAQRSGPSSQGRPELRRKRSRLEIDDGQDGAI